MVAESIIGWPPNLHVTPAQGSKYVVVDVVVEVVVVGVVVVVGAGAVIGCKVIKPDWPLHVLHFLMQKNFIDRSISQATKLQKVSSAALQLTYSQYGPNVFVTQLHLHVAASSDPAFWQTTPGHAAFVVAGMVVVGTVVVVAGVVVVVVGVVVVVVGVVVVVVGIVVVVVVGVVVVSTRLHGLHFCTQRNLAASKDVHVR